MLNITKTASLSGLKLLFLGFLCFLLMFLFWWIENEKRDPDRLVKKFEKVLNERQVYADEILKIEKQRIENGYSVFMFQGDSLIFWTDNTIPLSIGFCKQKQLTEPAILRLKNGWYLIQGKKYGNYCMFVLSLIKHAYPFENEYLKNKFAGYFGLPDKIDIRLDKSGKPVYFSDGKYALSLSIPQKNIRNYGSGTWYLLLFMLGFLFIILSILYFYDKIAAFFQWKYLLITGIFVDVLFLRGLQFYFKFPSFLYQTELFGPSYFSSSWFLPSLGDVLVNSLLMLVLACIAFLNWPAPSLSAASPKHSRLLKQIFIIVLALLSFIGILIFIESFVVNSIIPLNLQNISGLIPYSGFGFLIIWSLWACFFLFFWKPVQYALHYSNPEKTAVINLRISIVAIIVFSFISMLLINDSNHDKEKEKRKILALKLSSKRNPVTETLFSQIEKGIRTDTSVLNFAESTLNSVNLSSEQELEDYLKRKYFTGFWNKFNIQSTLCASNKDLQVQPQGYLINCQDYFQNIINEFGELTPVNNLFFLDYGYGKENYLAVIRLPVLREKNSIHTVNLYIELNIKYVFKDLGYPELLIDRRLVEIPDISAYSYAFYKNGKIQYNAGKFLYNQSIDLYRAKINQGLFFNFSGQNHLYYKLNGTEELLISKKQPNFLTTLSPFAYLFFFFGFLSFILFVFLNRPLNAKFSLKTLRDRLQLSIIGMLLLSFLVLGGVIEIYIIRLNNAKNDDYLRERALSILMEFRYKFGADDHGFHASLPILENQLIKMSNIFFSDINIYDPAGKLIASSRPQVFEEGLTSDRMNIQAMNQLKSTGQSLFIHDEYIGSHNYSSAYLPFFNDKNKLLGYINLPYFARQDDLKKEISTFLVTFINVYVLLFILGVFIAFFFAKYITLPLRLLAAKMGTFKLGRPNEKIDWQKKDEIGQLVDQYNKMVEEMEESAKKLAVSEREGAWREMARQVAHEIKNPLTPMKLNVQHLLRAWNDHTPDYDQRLERFAQTLTEQIDTLASIASEFSDFAKMPAPQKEKLDLKEVLQNVVFLYKDIVPITINLDDVVVPALIWADQKQLLRVFNNIFSNAIEAIEDKSNGQIEVTLHEKSGNYLLNISDNGRGISADQSNNIFQPNFTTKTGGMGLGLAIVKAILEEMNATIRVESEEGRGASFIIEIPSFQAEITPN